MKLALLLAVPFLAFPLERVDNLAWMAGCWTLSNGPLTIEEHWSTPAGGSMLGWSRTLKGLRVVFQEFMQIEPGADNKLVYRARIQDGRTATPFALKSSDGDSITFENPAHDFPQRIIYSRTSTGEMHARIEGLDRGKPKVQDFRYKRNSCER